MILFNQQPHPVSIRESHPAGHGTYDGVIDSSIMVSSCAPLVGSSDPPFVHIADRSFPSLCLLYITPHSFTPCPANSRSLYHSTYSMSTAQQCSTISEQHNTHMIQKSANVWATMNRTSLHHYRTELITHMEDVVLAQNLTDRYGEGRGIVMVAGNADTLWRVKWSLEMLRSYDSTLPVQIVSPS
jgi:hypothetical protein